MASKWLFFALLSNTLIFIYADDTSDIDIVTEKDDKLCTTKLTTCSVKPAGTSMKVMLSEPTKGEKGDMGSSGSMGEKGDRGFECQKGEKGDIGLPGAPGKEGTKGPPGEKGDKGLKGLIGLPGIQGPKGRMGSKGEKGNPGRPGENASKGEKGKTGPAGPLGPSGLPGLMGSCPCTYKKETDLTSSDMFDDDELFGPIDHPSTVVCKNAHITFYEPGEYFMGPGAIKVICEVREKKILTCIPPLHKDKVAEDSETIELTPGEEPFWLSSKGVTLEKLYNISQAQIAWLQERSNTAFQKIKFHCKNTMPYIPYDVDHSLLMSSWNDITFGPSSTNATPFSYTVPSESDGCFNSLKNEIFASSIIEIKSNSAHRLPVVDFLVRDINKHKSIRIEHLELCFN